ncbi:MAG TPA: alkaline phosphatase [Polyangiales bacterium]|nr:alkaline phosphatase [Polyangiales bacterium]
MQRGQQVALFLGLAGWILVAACEQQTPVAVIPDPCRHCRDAALDPPAADGGLVDAAVDGSVAADAGMPSEEPRLAHNIIVFMGDGMGPRQLATGRFTRGRLRLDALAGPALANTDSLSTLRLPDAPATDSAAAATVIATGMRVENDVLSLGPDGEPLESVLELCQRAGKSTGLVTTSYFFDASPSAFAVHQPSRSLYREIATEMLGVTRPDVVMGAGSWLLDDATTGIAQLATDSGYQVIRDLPALWAWNPAAGGRLLGLFETDFLPLTAASELFTMTPELERGPSAPDPTLATMTRRALERLGQDEDGFFLFAEDEIFDQISHRGPAEVAWANRALPQQVAALDAAVRVALDWVLDHSSFDETLIVVLADHETGGYQFDDAIGPISGDYTAFTDDGVLRVGYHTRTPIEVYALGPGSEAVRHITQHADTYRLLTGRLH